jgi:large subunit ribosomal protein L29
MKASQVHAMSVDQIREELETARQNLFNLRFQWATAQIRDHNLLKAARRDIARLETILRARSDLSERQARGQAGVGSEAEGE